MVVRDRSLRRYIIGPLLASGAVFLILLILAYFLFVPPLAAGMARLGLSAEQSSLLGTATFLFLVVFVSGVLYIAIAGFLSALLWDRLSLEVEKRTVGSAPEGSLSKSEVLADSFVRLLFSVAFGLIGTCCGWILFAIPGILIAGYIGLLDFTAPAFLRRNVTLGKQMRLLFKLDQSPTFLVAAGLLSLVPFVNVLVMPALVAGGTLMVLKSQSKLPALRQM
jgi:uncharacterized protein involved in cysteine biosynthesis